MAITGIGFNNIPYGADTWSDYEDDPQNNTTSLIIDYPGQALNQIAFRAGGRMRLGGHKMKIEGDELITLPNSVEQDTTFYFFVEVDVMNQKYNDIKFTTVEPLERGTYDNKLICPFGKIFVKKGNVILGDNPKTANVEFEDYLTNLAKNPIRHIASSISSYMGGPITLKPFTIMGKSYKPSDFDKMYIWTSDYDADTKITNDFDVQCHTIPLNQAQPDSDFMLGFMPICLICSRVGNNVVTKRVNLDNSWILNGTSVNSDEEIDKDVVVRLVVFEGLDPYAKGVLI